MKKLRPLFFLIGVGAYLAAGIIFLSGKTANPFSKPGWQRANPDFHGLILQAEFSPDGQKLAFEVRDDSGEFPSIDTYVYVINERKINKLAAHHWLNGWSADSRYLALNRRALNNSYLFEGRVYDVEREAVVDEFKLPFGGWLSGWSPNGKWQLFQHPVTRAVYVKALGKPFWLQLPEEVQDRALYWSRDGNSLLFLSYEDKSRKLLRYDIALQALQTIATLNEYEVRFPFLLMPDADEVLFLTSGAPESYTYGIIRKLDLNSGRVIFALDIRDRLKGVRLYKMFVSPDPDVLYISTVQKQANKKTGGNVAGAVSLNLTTGAMEEIISKEYLPLSYCRERDMFAVRSMNDFTDLYLFDVKSGIFDFIFPLTYTHS